MLFPKLICNTDTCKTDFKIIGEKDFKAKIGHYNYGTTNWDIL